MKEELRELSKRVCLEGLVRSVLLSPVEELVDGDVPLLSCLPEPGLVRACHIRLRLVSLHLRFSDIRLHKCLVSRKTEKARKHQELNVWARSSAVRAGDS